jgi:hypothetical protein
VRNNSQSSTLAKSVSGENPVSFGGSHPTIDKIERVVQAPRRAFWKLANKPLVDQAELESNLQQSAAWAQHYLVANGISDVNIDVRRYEPMIQWQRLKANEDVGPIWKYTGGAISQLRYTLFPKRAFHSNAYDPYTNTIHLNSSSDVDGVYYAAEAKQYYKQPLRGTYAIAQYFPLVPLVHSMAAASDSIKFSQASNFPELERKLIPASYAKVGSSVATQGVALGIVSSAVYPEVAALRWIGSKAGRAAGRAFVKQRDSKNASAE